MKYLYIFFILLINLNCIFGESFHMYEENLINSFGFGTKIDNFTFNDNAPPAENKGPSTFSFDKNENIYILDSWANSMLVFNKNFELITIIKLNVQYNIVSKQIEINYDRLIFYNLAYSIKIYENEELLSDIGQRQNRINQNINHDSFIYNNGLVFFWLNNGEINMFDNPGPDKSANVNKTINREEILDRISKYEIGIYNGITIDENNRLFYNKELITRDYEVYINYQISKYNSYEEWRSNNPYIINADLRKSNNKTYLGKDTNNNIYWKTGNKRILVFNSEGHLLDKFQYNRDISKTLPAVHPSGDVYFLDYDENEVRLYKITRRW